MTDYLVQHISFWHRPLISMRSTFVMHITGIWVLKLIIYLECEMLPWFHYFPQTSLNVDTMRFACPPVTYRYEYGHGKSNTILFVNDCTREVNTSTHYFYFTKVMLL